MATRGERVLKQFEAGKIDLMSRFSIPPKLYGREKELAILTSSFERVLQGAAEVFPLILCLQHIYAAKHST